MRWTGRKGRKKRKRGRRESPAGVSRPFLPLYIPETS